MTLIPAYGRDYRSKKAILVDWHANEVFIIADCSSPDDGRYTNRAGLVGETSTVSIRYSRLTKIAVIDLQGAESDD